MHRNNRQARIHHGNRGPPLARPAAQAHKCRDAQGSCPYVTGALAGGLLDERGHDLMPFCVDIGAFRQLRGIGTDQFVKEVPPRPVFGDQGGAGQLGYQPARRFRRDAEHAGTGRGRDISGRMPWQHPEKTAGLRAEVMVRPREDGPCVGVHAGRAKCVEAALRAAAPRRVVYEMTTSRSISI